MAIPLYLAMTAEEFAKNTPHPDKVAWMACHFSHYGRGISDLPDKLPEGSVLILNDRVPIADHDPERICKQLSSWMKHRNLRGLLLDFQVPDNPKTALLTRYLTEELPCQVTVSSYYAQKGRPVFLPPVPLQIPLSEYLSPWEDFEIWLDASLGTCCMTVDHSGCHISDASDSGPFPHVDSVLHCRYRTCCEDGQVHFLLSRTKKDLASLLSEAENSGVTTAVGLYQELGRL